MNLNNREQEVEARNLIFTACGLAALLFLLTVFTEKRVGSEKVSFVSATKPAVMSNKPVIPGTTVKIQPLVTEFPPLPDFDAYNRVDKRKAAFIDYLKPIIDYQNSKILRERNRLEEISKRIVNGEQLSGADTKWLKRLAEKYKVDWAKNDHGAVVIKLSRRVDIIPVSLALVQAAKESSWGRSRYAVQVNNLFGQWCFDEGCGVIPGERIPGAVHEVKRFDSVYDATRSYIHNLNTHPRYKTLRDIRQQLRMYRRPITGNDLADGLLYYSERRQDYIDEVKSMIRQFKVFQQQRSG